MLILLELWIPLPLWPRESVTNSKKTWTRMSAAELYISYMYYRINHVKS